VVFLMNGSAFSSSMLVVVSLVFSLVTISYAFG